MKAPDKIKVNVPYKNVNQEYIRKDVVDDMLKTAEDHAYFAGKEKMREELLEWAKKKLEEYALKTFEKHGDATHWGQRNAFQQMIDNLNVL